MIEQPDDLPSRPSKNSRSIEFPQWDKWGDHPGRGLTPSRIVSIYRGAEIGYPQEQNDLFEDVIESDAHLRSQMDCRIEAVSGKAWIVQAGGDDPADAEAAQLLEEALRKIPSFIDMVEHQLTANFYGYAGSEIMWDLQDGTFVPVWFANVPQRRFVFDRTDRPMLLTSQNLTDGEPLEPGRWIFSHRRGRITAASGLMRTAVWWSLFKRMAVRDRVIFAERYGIPYLTGTYADNTPAEEKKTLNQALREFGKDGGATFHESCKINVHQIPMGESEVHGSTIDCCNAELSKLISGATLQSDPKGTGGGASYALGSVHQDTRFDLIQGDAEHLELRFEQDVSIPFIKFNAINARPPRLKIAVVRTMDPMARAKLFQIFQEMGGDVDADQIRQEMQFKKPVSEDQALKLPQPTPATDGNQPQTPGAETY